MKLKIFQDDANEIMEKEREASNLKIQQYKEEVQNEILSLKKERDNYKLDFNAQREEIARIKHEFSNEDVED